MSTEDKPKTITLNRAQRRAILKPWKSRKANREGVRRKAAFDIDLQQRLMQALRKKAEEGNPAR